MYFCNIFELLFSQIYFLAAIWMKTQIVIGWGCEEKARGVGEIEGGPQGHEGESSLTS